MNEIADHRDDGSGCQPATVEGARIPPGPDLRRAAFREREKIHMCLRLRGTRCESTRLTCNHAEGVKQSKRFAEV